MAFASIADVEALTGADVADTERANLILELASAVVGVEARQLFAKETNDVIDVAGTWDCELTLPQRPVLNVSEVVITDPTIAIDVTVPPGSYAWRRDGMLWIVTPTALVNAPSSWADGTFGGPHSTVRVTYDHGFDEIPAVVRFVTASYASRLLTSGETAAAGIGSETFDGSYQVTYTSGQTGSVLPADLRRLLRPFDRRLHTMAT